MLWGDLTSPSFKWSPGNPLPFADLATLEVDATYGNGAFPGSTMKDGEHVRLGDGSTAYWNGSIWIAGKAPDEVVVLVAANPAEDPGGYTIGQVQAFVGSDLVLAQQALDNEVAGSNRVTLVAWLEDLLGI